MKWLNWPNRFTIARILFVAPLVICLLNLGEWEHARHVALGLFCAVSLTDALDGYLARRLGEETPLGRFLDPVADKLLITSCVILLATGPAEAAGVDIPNWVPVIAIGKDLLIILGFGLVYLTTGQFFVEPRPLGKTCTLLQLFMIAVVLVSPDLPPRLREASPLFWWAASGLAIAAAVDYLVVGNRFARQHHADQEKSSPS
ncbi:MAG: CDP-alcohol phosphatidyltransferase family protein [Planctomycetes bacterium]|nr:CDP-alcohol phosphatidyltransferase family protein [Planctomycetota bacterium]